MLARADALRRELNGDVVTYVVTRNVQYTNVCYFRCGFCAFSKGKLAANLRGEPYLVPHAGDRPAGRRGVGARCDRDLPAGWHPSRRSTATTTPRSCARSRTRCRICTSTRSARSRSGRARRRSALDLDAYLARLRDEGLASLPGTAAEVLDDEVRAVICPDKISTSQWLDVHEAAHRAGLRSNVTIMFGHVDGPRNWARHLLAVRELQRRTGGFTEFVPLPFVHMEAPIYLRGGARRGPTFGELLRDARSRADRARIRGSRTCRSRG